MPIPPNPNPTKAKTELAMTSGISSQPFLRTPPTEIKILFHKLFSPKSLTITETQRYITCFDIFEEM